MSKVVHLKVLRRSKGKEAERATRVVARKTTEPMTIANCQFEFKCPKQWGALTNDGKLDSRLCGACDRRVHLCVTDEELQARAAAGDCVALYRPQDFPLVRGSVSQRQGPIELLLGVLRPPGSKQH